MTGLRKPIEGARAIVERMARTSDPEVRRMTRDIVRRRERLRALGDVVHARIRRGEL